MLTDEQRAQLAEAIPRSAIKEKPGQGGKLSYVKGGWVMAELNRILGPDGWSLTVHEITPLPGDKPNCLARVRLDVHPGGEPACWREDVACGTGTGFDGWHQAAGEAVTDATKRCAARLGLRLGGQLYLDAADVRERTEKPAPKRTEKPVPRVMTPEYASQIIDALRGPNGAACVGKARRMVATHECSNELRQSIEAAIEEAEAL